MKFVSLIILLFVVSGSVLHAQWVNPSSEKIPKLPLEMSYQEYQQLVRNLNWKRIGIAAMVPGYIHFYANHRHEADWIAGLRGSGMLLSASMVFRQWRETKTFQFVHGAHWETNFSLFFVGMFMNAAGFAFDWAHGDWIIEKERTQVQYKYGLKRGMLSANFISCNPRFLFTWSRRF